MQILAKGNNAIVLFKSCSFACLSFHNCGFCFHSPRLFILGSVDNGYVTLNVWLSPHMCLASFSLSCISSPVVREADFYR